MDVTIGNLSSNVSNITINTSMGPKALAPGSPSLAQRVISAIAMSVLIILSISGNALVIASFYYYKKIRKSVTNCFIVSLAVSDLMVAFLSEPFWLSYQITNWQSFPQGWDLNTFITFWTILDISCAIASIVNLMFISIDRYFAIKSPLTHHTRMTPETSVWIIIALWLYSIGTGCVFLIHEWKWRYLLIFIIGFVVPLIIMIFCYVGIMVVISSKARLSNQVGSTRLDKEFKTAKSLGVVTGSFVFCWLPFFIVSLLYQYCPVCKDEIEKMPAIVSAAKWLHYLNSCLNPIIYAFLNPTFKVAFRNLFRRFCNDPNNINDDMTITTMIFPSSRRHNTRKRSHENGSRTPNGKQKSKPITRKLLRFKTPVEESLQDSYSENFLDKPIQEQTFIEKGHESDACIANQANDKKCSSTEPRPERHVHYRDDQTLQANSSNHIDVDSSSIVSDSNNNPNDHGRPTTDSSKPITKTDRTNDLPLSTVTDTSGISTYHDHENNQFYFFVGGQYIPEKDLKTSDV